MRPDELLHLVERSFVWHAVGDLLRGVDPVWLVLGVLVLLVLAVVSSRGPKSATSWRPALQRSTATVHCQCGRVWTVRT